MTLPPLEVLDEDGVVVLRFLQSKVKSRGFLVVEGMCNLVARIPFFRFFDWESAAAERAPVTG